MFNRPIVVSFGARISGQCVLVRAILYFQLLIFFYRIGKFVMLTHSQSAK